VWIGVGGEGERGEERRGRGEEERERGEKKEKEERSVIT
jgi:hypothetical protein